MPTNNSTEAFFINALVIKGYLAPNIFSNSASGEESYRQSKPSNSLPMSKVLSLYLYYEKDLNRFIKLNCCRIRLSCCPLIILSTNYNTKRCNHTINFIIIRSFRSGQSMITINTLKGLSAIEASGKDNSIRPDNIF